MNRTELCDRSGALPHLAVILSNNTGLRTWRRIGSLSRELAIYKKFTEQGWVVSFYTYDLHRTPADVGFPANIHSQWPYLLPKNLGFLYRRLLPFLRFPQGCKADIILTNQAYSSGTAILAGRLWSAKVVARCGYVYGENAETLEKSGRKITKKILEEKLTFSKSDRCIVPTPELGDWIFQNYGIAPEKTKIIPNYVDTELFKPDPRQQKDFDIICIGRLVAMKRHSLLLEALAGSKLRIWLIGNGRLKDDLRSLAEETKLDVKMTPRIEHTLLPQSINRAKIYVNLAIWEGHPKALIEAMACGCACIGAKSPGIQNLIIDGKTGLLVDPEPGQIRSTVERLLTNRELREQLGTNARNYALEHFSLAKVFRQYRDLFEELLPK